MIFMNLQCLLAARRGLQLTFPLNGASIASMQPFEAVQALYPPIEPYANTHVDVGDGHQIYVEQCGSAQGMPMVYVHGGPGSGCSPRHRQFFDPKQCRAVLFDQRGCGRSVPSGALQHNYTDALVQDMEILRDRLGIARWLVVGGSWGAGLALAYAAAHPEACLGLVLRGVFLGRDSDTDWFFRGAAQLLPDAWQQLVDQVAPEATNDLLQRLHAGLHGPDATTALRCAMAWEAWEQSLSQHCGVAARALTPNDRLAVPLIAKYRLQSHYLVHQCFRQGQGLLQPARVLATLPTAIVHGRLDWICRAETAWHVHRTLDSSRLQWVDGGGHNPFEAANATALVSAIDHFARHGNFSDWGSAFSHTANHEP